VASRMPASGRVEKWPIPLKRSGPTGIGNLR
jgi:hypothetical protein